MIKFFTTFSYFKYFLSAQSKFKIHSPFVYDLVNAVFKSEVPKEVTQKIAKKRKKLYANKTVLEIVDFGAGSAKNHVRRNGRSRSKRSKGYKAEFKPVQKIAKSALLQPKYAELLYKLIHHFKPATIVELGTSLGITTSKMALANPLGKLYSLEGCASIAAVAQENIRKLGIKNVQIKLGEFNTTLPEVIGELATVDFVFFDGNHRKEATLDYFERFLPLKNNDSIFVFDDIYWSKGMSEAWKTIKSHPDTVLTIDIFQMGIVFFKKELSPQHIFYRF